MDRKGDISKPLSNIFIDSQLTCANAEWALLNDFLTDNLNMAIFSFFIRQKYL